MVFGKLVMAVQYYAVQCFGKGSLLSSCGFNSYRDRGAGSLQARSRGGARETYTVREVKYAASSTVLYSSLKDSSLSTLDVCVTPVACTRVYVKL